jgi:thiol-disulfide isomerase/thioredoxin
MAGKKRPAPKRIIESRPTTSRSRAEENGAGGGAGAAGNGDTTTVRRSDPARRAVTQVTRTPGQAPGRGTGAGRGGTSARPGGAGRGAAGAPAGGGSKARARQAGRAVATPGRRVSPAMWGWGVGSLVLVAIVVIALLAVTNHQKNTSKGHVTVAASVVHATTNVPQSVFDSVGIGGNKISTSSPAGNPVALIKGPYKPGNGLPPVNGKPVVFYFGALFCPYCATERWPLIVALSRFGTFKNLAGAVSSSTDVFPNTETWSFVGSSYSSPYLVFRPVEAEGEQQEPLEALTAAEQKVLTTWDPKESFPFMTIGNRYTAGLPGWLDPQGLQSLSRAEIAQTLALGSTNTLGNGIIANANYLTAAICNVTGQQPSTVCSSSGVKAALDQLKKVPAATPIR